MMPRDMTSDLVSEQFRKGKMAFVINGPWFKGDLGQLDPTKWGTAPLPIVSATQKPLRPFLGVEGVMLSSRSKHPQHAWQLIQWIASKKSAQRRMAQGQLVAHTQVYESTQITPWLKTFKAQFKRTIPLSNAPIMKRMWTPMKRALSNVILFNGDAQEALNVARMQIKKAMGPEADSMLKKGDPQ
jgi:maltose-binding protein MalE